MTTTYVRKGNRLILDGIAGNIDIVPSYSKDQISIDVTTDSANLIGLSVGSKHKTVRIKSTSGIPFQAGYKISVPSGITLVLEHVGGKVQIVETIGHLIIHSQPKCAVFTELVQSLTVRELRQDCTINIKRLLGNCSIASREESTIFIREACINALYVNAAGGSNVDIHGSARAAMLLCKSSHVSICTVGLLTNNLSRNTHSSSVNIGWVNKFRLDAEDSPDLANTVFELHDQDEYYAKHGYEHPQISTAC